jgi:CRISPR-associated protein Cas1
MTEGTRTKGKRALVLTDPTVLVRRANERLVMLRDGKEVGAVPLRELSHVSLHGPVTLTGAAVAGLLDAGIDVTLYTSFGKLRGVLQGSASSNVFLRLAQAAAWMSDARKVAFARPLLASKIEGQRVLLQRQARDRGSTRCRQAAEVLGRRGEELSRAADLNALRGVEGSAAAEYWDAFGDMLSEGWSFPGRVRRPARDPVNAILNFGYVLATGEVTRLLVQGGFDTELGMVHGLRYGRDSLALDLVEEFRAPLVDRFTLRLLNTRQLAPGDFIEVEDGAVRLSAEARVQYLSLWDAVLRERVSLLRGEVEDEADAEHSRTQRIERPPDPDAEEPEVSDDASEGKPGPREGPGAEGLTWRYRIERQVSRYRRFLMNDEPFRPLAEPRKPRNL